jgi:hypothetical protein
VVEVRVVVSSDPTGLPEGAMLALARAAETATIPTEKRILIGVS